MPCRSVDERVAFKIRIYRWQLDMHSLEGFQKSSLGFCSRFAIAIPNYLMIIHVTQQSRPWNQVDFDWKSLQMRHLPIDQHPGHQHSLSTAASATEWFAAKTAPSNTIPSRTTDTMWRLAVDCPECCTVDEPCFLYLHSLRLLIFGSISEPCSAKPLRIEKSCE